MVGAYLAYHPVQKGLKYEVFTRSSLKIVHLELGLACQLAALS